MEVLRLHHSHKIIDFIKSAINRWSVVLIEGNLISMNSSNNAAKQHWGSYQINNKWKRIRLDYELKKDTVSLFGGERS